MKWLILCLGVVANAGASILVKYAMLPPREFPSLSNIHAALTNWPFWLGLVMYGVTFLLYAAALARLPLNVAHPVLTSGAIVLVAIMSAILFREDFPWTTILGVILVATGVMLITLRVA